MATDTQSPQEALLRSICDQSMSSLFVFCPDISRRRPSKQTEPADIAWVCNGCVILMYLTESKISDDMEKNKRELRKAQSHNLGQAKRWLKEWKSTPLEGKNAHHKFWLEYKNSTRIVVLSIIHGGYTVADVHTDLATRQGISLCATIPQSFLEELIMPGGSPVDLILLLQKIHGLGEVSESESLRILLAYREECYEKSNQEVNKQTVFDPKDLTEQLNWIPWPVSKGPSPLVYMAARQLVALMKSRASPVPGRGESLHIVTNSNVGEEFGIFNDIGLADIWLVSKAIALGWHNVITNDLMALEIGLRLAHYDCGLCVLASTKCLTEAQRIDKAWAERRAKGIMRPGPTICYVIDKDHLFVCASSKGKAASHIELLLRSA